MSHKSVWFRLGRPPFISQFQLDWCCHSDSLKKSKEDRTSGNKIKEMKWNEDGKQTLKDLFVFENKCNPIWFGTVRSNDEVRIIIAHTPSQWLEMNWGFIVLFMFWSTFMQKQTFGRQIEISTQRMPLQTLYRQIMISKCSEVKAAFNQYHFKFAAMFYCIECNGWGEKTPPIQRDANLKQHQL